MFQLHALDQYFVHNANLLGASLLARLAKYTADESIKDVALSSLRYSMHHQKEDGSWYYAEKRTLIGSILFIPGLISRAFCIF